MHVYCGCGCNFVVASCLQFSFCGRGWGPPRSILEVSCVMYCVLYKGSPEFVVGSQLISSGLYVLLLVWVILKREVKRSR